MKNDLRHSCSHTHRCENFENTSNFVLSQGRRRGHADTQHKLRIHAARENLSSLRQLAFKHSDHTCSSNGTVQYKRVEVFFNVFTDFVVMFYAKADTGYFNFYHFLSFFTIVLSFLIILPRKQIYNSRLFFQQDNKNKIRLFFYF